MYNVILVGGLKKKTLYMKQKIKTGGEDNPSTVHGIYLNCRELLCANLGQGEKK